MILQIVINRLKCESKSIWSNNAPMDAPAEISTDDSPMQPIMQVSPAASQIAARRVKCFSHPWTCCVA